MPEMHELCEKMEHTISEIREKATARHWANYSRHAFVNNLQGILPLIEHLNALFRETQAQIETSAEPAKPDISQNAMEMEQLISVLKRNMEMEQVRIRHPKGDGMNVMAQTITVPELYADLEQKTLSMLLKSAYAIERIRLFERKRNASPANTKQSQRGIFDLLEQKEKELEELRKRYEENRKNTFLGLVEKESSIEIENELNETARGLESRTALMRKLFETTKENFSKMENQMRELEERIFGVEELESQITAKTFELITMLKKERDYTKKVLMEIEHETLQLRNTYSKELLNLQEEKIGMKNTLEERHAKQLAELRNELRSKTDTIRHLQETLSSKEHKITKLEEANERLELVGKALHKHAAIKQHFLHGKKHSAKTKK